MGNEVLKNLLGAVYDIDVAPVDPGVLWLHGSGQEVVAGATHGLPSGTLSLERVALLDALAKLEAEVLLDNHSAVEGDLVRAALDAIQFRGQDCESIILGIADQESEVDQVVGVGKLGNQLEVFGQVRGGVLERGKDQDALLVVDGLAGGLDGVEVDVLDGGVVDLQGLVVVEDDGGLEVASPRSLLIERHLHGGFRGAPAVEAICGHHMLAGFRLVQFRRSASRKQAIFFFRTTQRSADCQGAKDLPLHLRS